MPFPSSTAPDVKVGRQPVFAKVGRAEYDESGSASLGVRQCTLTASQAAPRTVVIAHTLRPFDGSLDDSRAQIHRLLADELSIDARRAVVLLLELAGRSRSDWVRQDVVLISALVAAAAHAGECHRVNAVLDCGDVRATLEVCGRVAEGRLPLPKGSVIRADEWSLLATGTPATAGSMRLVPAGGTPALGGDVQQIAAILRRIGVATADTAAARLFAGESASARQVEEQIGRPAIDDLVLAGLLIPEASLLRPTMVLREVNGLNLLSDFDLCDNLQGPGYLDPLWEGPLLSRCIPQQPIRAALDLGCGCGLLSLVLSGTAAEVVAVDINPRALAVTRLNAALAQCANVQTCPSDLFSGLGRRRFDGIVFNAPIDVEGTDALSLLASGQNLLDRFIKQLPAALSPGGWAVANIAWTDDGGGDPADSLLAEFAHAGRPARDVSLLITRERKFVDCGIWRRGVLLVAPGAGTIRRAAFNASQCVQRVRPTQIFSMDSWLAAIGSAP